MDYNVDVGMIAKQQLHSLIQCIPIQDSGRIEYIQVKGFGIVFSEFWPGFSQVFEIAGDDQGDIGVGIVAVLEADGLMLGLFEREKK